MALDSTGDLLIADSGNNVIRKVHLSDGVITTVAGDYADGAGYCGDGSRATSAQLDLPQGIAVDLRKIYILPIPTTVLFGRSIMPRA